MLEDFDASRLEELAESLLADVITDLAEDSPAGSPIIAEGAGTPQRMPRPVVGTQTKLMEPATNTNASVRTTTPVRRIVPKPEATPIAPAPKRRLINVKTPIYTKTTKPKNTSPNVDHRLTASSIGADAETLYGTYDEKTNCITIVLPDENISISEAVEEIGSCEEDDHLQDIKIGIKEDLDDVTVGIKEYIDDIPMLSPIPSHYSSPDYYSSAKSTYGGSETTEPILLASESGYESLGSPSSNCPMESEFINISDLWNSSCAELFPSLL